CGEIVQRTLVLQESMAAQIHPIAFLPASVLGDFRVQRLQEADRAARAVSPEIVQTSVTYLDRDQHVTIVNSEGLFTSDRRVYTRLIVRAVASDGKENQTGTMTPGAMRGAELFDTIDAAEVGRRAAIQAQTMLHAPVCPAGIMPVVIGNGFGGVIFHEACGHSLEATSVARNQSEFCGKLGQQVASPIVTAIDDGTMPNEWGSSNLDDEGMPTSRLVLIEKGILRNYMIDRLNGRRMQMAPTGSARRQSYAFAPTSRMRNTFIAPGTDDDEEMIRTMGDGLYAAAMGGGSVNPTTGEFNFAVLEGYLVHDGRIQTPVRGASLIGRGSEILLKIDRVGCDMKMAQGMCGSLSGSVPTNVGQPRIRVQSMTVGGR
ncbi:MAG: TldD/PmbA family protein, partial [Clostridia bacterium]